MEVAGEVRQFDDEHQKLTLYKVQAVVASNQISRCPPITHRPD